MRINTRLISNPVFRLTIESDDGLSGVLLDCFNSHEYRGHLPGSLWLYKGRWVESKGRRTILVLEFLKRAMPVGEKTIDFNTLPDGEWEELDDESGN